MWGELGRAVRLAIALQLLLLEGSLCRIAVPSQRRVVGGSDAAPGQFPWQAQLRSYVVFGPTISCGATLVTDQHLLTAAHCVQSSWLLAVRLGQVNQPALPGEGLLVFVSGLRTFQHPYYDWYTNDNDIAVVTLMDKILPTATIHPIHLPDFWEEGEFLDGKEAIVTGFGKTRDDEETSHPVLQYSKLRILQHSRCADYYKVNFGILITASQICTTYIENVSGVCSGDSGGPLIINNKNGIPTLVGVVSLGITPCEDGGPSVYTAVADYIWWIDQVIQLGPS